MVVDIIAAFLSGACTKISDSGSKPIVRALGGLIAGALSYYLAAFQQIPEIVFGAVFGNMLAGKIDKNSHYILVATLFFLYAIYGVTISILPLVLFAFTAYMDEIFSGRRNILGKRILLPLSALLYAIIDPLPLFYIIFWDAGYRSTSYLIKRG